MIIKYTRTETYTLDTDELKEWFEFENEEDEKEALTNRDNLKILLEDLSHDDLLNISSKYHYEVQIV